MNLEEYRSLDGLVLADRLAKGEVSPVELMQAALEIGARFEPMLNALCYIDPELGLSLARAANRKGPFGAIPFLLKDSGLASRTLKGSVGSRLFEGSGSAIDATLTSRFVEAGFLPYGRTTVPEFCMAPTTEAAVYGGPTRNPWDFERSPGGSSGGAAAAVAAGIVPVAHGSDGGGSIRIPAACCGVYGLKPSRGLVPYGPLRGEGWAGLAVDGVISRSVRDTAAAMDSIAGMERGQPYAAPGRPDSYLALLDRAFNRPMRIARWTKAWDDIPIAAECIAALDKATKTLSSLGHEVIDADLPEIKYASFIEAIIDVMATNVAVTVGGVLRSRPDGDPRDLLEPAIHDAYQMGRTMPAERYALAVTRFHGIGRTLENYIAGFDFILTPTLTKPPLRLGELSMSDDFRSFRRKAGLYTTFLAIINASGQPAANIPLHRDAAGMPIGVQLIAPFGGEADLMRLSAQIESEAPWGHLLPPIPI
ncbi:amidase [Shinella daejeonensis]|nr:amidase [Shinella daejeonensis]